MKQMTRVISLLLALLMAFSLTAAAADALTITSATADGADLEGATVPAGSSITLVFSNNVTDESVFANNIAKIKVKNAEGSDTGAAVTAGDKNTLIVTLAEDLAKGSYTLTVGKDVQAKNGTTLGTKAEYSFTVKGSGGGTGGGNNPLTVESVLVNGEPLEGKELKPGDEIVIQFSRGMRDHLADNVALIRVLKEDGAKARYAVEGNADPDNENAKREFIVTLYDNDSGSLTLVLGAGLKANNGNTLGEDVTVSFTFKADEAPEPTNPTLLERVKAFFTSLFDKIVSFFKNLIPSDSSSDGVLSKLVDTLRSLFGRLFPKVA